MINVCSITVMKLSIKAENGGKFYDYTITKAEWLKLAELAFDAEVQGQKEAKKETVKAGGCVSGFLHAYGVTTEKDEKSMSAGNDSAFPTGATSKDAEGKETVDDEFSHVNWLVAWNHSTGRSTSYESRLAAWEKKVTALMADFIEFGATPEAARTKAESRIKKPEAPKA